MPTLDDDHIPPVRHSVRRCVVADEDATSDVSEVGVDVPKGVQDV
jgi:hypothetical protein